MPNKQINVKLLLRPQSSIFEFYDVIIWRSNLLDNEEHNPQGLTP